MGRLSLSANLPFTVLLMLIGRLFKHPLCVCVCVRSRASQTCDSLSLEIQEQKVPVCLCARGVAMTTAQPLTPTSINHHCSAPVAFLWRQLRCLGNAHIHTYFKGVV